MILLDADPSNCGYVTQDTGVRTGIVLVEDDNVNKQLKGYFSFDLLSLYDSESLEISDAIIYFTSINKSGNPESTFTILDFKAIEYVGLELSDFAPRGIRIKEVNTNDFMLIDSHMLTSE